MLFELKDEHGSSIRQCFHLINKWCGDFDILVPAAQEQASQAHGDIQLLSITSGLLWKHMQFASRGKIIELLPSLYGSTYLQFYFKVFTNIVH